MSCFFLPLIIICVVYLMDANHENGLCDSLRMLDKKKSGILRHQSLA